MAHQFNTHFESFQTYFIHFLETRLISWIKLYFNKKKNTTKSQDHACMRILLELEDDLKPCNTDKSIC